MSSDIKYYNILKTLVLTKKIFIIFKFTAKKKKIDTSKKTLFNLFDLSYKIDIIVFLLLCMDINTLPSIKYIISAKKNYFQLYFIEKKF